MLIHGDTLVYDRWRWLSRRLPPTANHEQLIDIGCGNGAFTIGAALRGYDAIGLTWDQEDSRKATKRAQLSRAKTVHYQVQDVRELAARRDLAGRFDFVICTENIEHILDDFKLMADIAWLLRPGGTLLLTTPNAKYIPISQGDKGPFSTVETGDHVRRGYTESMLKELCISSGLVPEKVTYCGGFVSQKATWCFRQFSTRGPLLAFLAMLPLRTLVVILDPLITPVLAWPRYSICLEAYKPRL